MLWKPNVYVDISLLTQLWTPDQLAAVLRQYLSQFPEKILFGTDADAFGPGLNWGVKRMDSQQHRAEGDQYYALQMVRSNELNTASPWKSPGW